MVLIIPLSLSFIQQPENYVALLDILVHFFCINTLFSSGMDRAALLFTRPSSPEKGKILQVCLGKCHGFTNVFEEVDSEKFPPQIGC